ncbi:MAG: flagellar hook-length control protein FliK, partial [Planctomycetia bacterium]|nr:flagellar hook-length control protein FliK [Planctomycetia bacterium]
EQRAAEADGEAANERRVKHSSGEPIKGKKLALQDERDAAQEANHELAASGSDDDGQVPEATGQEGDALRKNDSQQRRGDRSDVATSQPTDKTPNIGTQSVDSAIVEAAADSSSDDSSRQRRNHSDTGSTPPIGPATTVDETTTTLGTPSRFAQHLLAKTGDSSTRGKGLTDADQARFVDRVARAVQATGDRGGTLRLRLSPPELGSLTLEIKVQGGAITARVEADTPTARTLLLENLPVLRERLAEQGLRVDQFDVDLTDRHAGGTPDGLQQNEQQQENHPRSKNSSHEPEETPRAKSPET